jgi:predicted nucleic acid-binding protein
VNKGIIVLDSSPLGLLFHEARIPEAHRCREWIARHIAQGTTVLVPEIVHYELRRELLRLRKTAAVAALDAFNRAVTGRYLPITTDAMELAPELWADARRRGTPTAHPHALDVDVILAAQVLSRGLKPADFVVATTNMAHLSQFVPAELWSSI